MKNGGEQSPLFFCFSPLHERSELDGASAARGRTLRKAPVRPHRTKQSACALEVLPATSSRPLQRFAWRGDASFTLPLREGRNSASVATGIRGGVALPRTPPRIA